MKIICIDTETTGLSYRSDELLQVSIVDGESNTLFNQRIKPVRVTSWPDAQKINEITPESVSNCKPFSCYVEEIQQLLADADIIVGYNLRWFDLAFLSYGGVDMTCLKPEAHIVDIMEAYAEIHGEWLAWKHGFKWQKLETCAKHYGYSCSHYHDALEDAKTTLLCFHAMFPNPDEIPRSGTGLTVAQWAYIPKPSSQNTSDSVPAPEKTPHIIRDDTCESKEVPDSVIYGTSETKKMSSSAIRNTAKSQEAHSKHQKKKTGRIMIACGILFIIAGINSGLTTDFFIAVLLLYFGIRRYKKFKNDSKTA